MDIKSDALIIAHPLDLNFFLSLLSKPDKKEPLYLAKLFLFPSLTIVGPCLGAPQLILILEKLIKIGIKKILFWGWCGGVDPNLKIGDIILPLEARKNTKIFLPKRNFLNYLIANLPFSYYSGSIFSIENPYELKKETILIYQKFGIMAIDMETATLYEFSVKKEIEVASLLIVSDIFKPDWKEGFTHPSFKDTRKKLAKWLFEKYERKII